MNKEKTNYGWRVTTETPIYVLLLRSESEYYNYIQIDSGVCDCGCELVETFKSEIETMQYIMDNNISKYFAYDTDNIQ